MTRMTAAMMKSKTGFTAVWCFCPIFDFDNCTNKSQNFSFLREIERMKQARGASGISGEADDDNFQVVPVESTSE